MASSNKVKKKHISKYYVKMITKKYFYLILRSGASLLDSTCTLRSMACAMGMSCSCSSRPTPSRSKRFTLPRTFQLARTCSGCGPTLQRREIQHQILMPEVFCGKSKIYIFYNYHPYKHIGSILYNSS